jgi:O-antigen/teichoic acid export membrane protein
MKPSMTPITLPRFRHGLAANLAGSAWTAALQLICIPFYVKFIGIEGYGVVSFYLMFQSVAQVLDLGLSPTMNREMARYSVQPEKSAEARDFVRTLEAGYWLIGLFLAMLLVIFAPWIAVHWVRADTLSALSLRRAIELMGLLMLFQWPVSFYQGGLLGLHRQLSYNAVRMIASAFSGIGGVLLLWIVSATIQTLLLWQIGVAVAQAIVLSVLLWRCLPSAPRASRFVPGLLKNIRGFAMGVSAITLMALLLTQIDKILVSKLLPLAIFGYYSLAWSLANGMSLIAMVVFNVACPRMSAQVAAGDDAAVRENYHLGAQIMAALVLPLAAVFLFFPSELIYLWTRNTATATFVAPIFRIMVIGSALNALLYIPYALQLAFGWIKLTLAASLVFICFIVPFLFFATRRFGPVGAASGWAALNVLNLLIVVPLMHRRLLRSEMFLYFREIGFPMIGAISVAAFGRMLISRGDSATAEIAQISTVLLVAFVVAVLASPRIRIEAFAWLSGNRLGGGRELAERL